MPGILPIGDPFLLICTYAAMTAMRVAGEIAIQNREPAWTMNVYAWTAKWVSTAATHYPLVKSFELINGPIHGPMQMGCGFRIDIQYCEIKRTRLSVHNIGQSTSRIIMTRMATISQMSTLCFSTDGDGSFLRGTDPHSTI